MIVLTDAGIDQGAREDQVRFRGLSASGGYDPDAIDVPAVTAVCGLVPEPWDDKTAIETDAGAGGTIAWLERLQVESGARGPSGGGESWSLHGVRGAGWSTRNGRRVTKVRVLRESGRPSVVSSSPGTAAGKVEWQVDKTTPD
ncbi:MAG TPA: hypothetical protein VKE40_03965 [Gemmataceae bacterium]|nr:hypothetical protein [Gemmataceae bacterium]